jgi:hypothetical protein
MVFADLYCGPLVLHCPPVVPQSAGKFFFLDQSVPKKDNTASPSMMVAGAV